MTNLQSCVNDWTEQLDSKLCMDVIYIVSTKAFGSVSHKKLIHKLSKYGNGGVVSIGLISFIRGRTQRIKVGKKFSQLQCVLVESLRGRGSVHYIV